MTASPFAQAAPALMDLGFVPVTIIPPSVTHHAGRSKAPGQYSGGGWSGFSGWSKLVDEPLSGFNLKLAMTAPEAGCGIVLGTPAGTDAEGRPLAVIGIDYDVDGDDLDTLLRATKASPMAKVPRRGLTRLFRAPPTIVSKSYDGQTGRILDLLAKGRQTVVPPSLTIDEGKAYRWIGDGPVAARDLPIFDEESLAELEEALETVGWHREGKRQAASRAERQPFIAGDYDPDDPFSVAKAAALGNLSAWVPALNLYGCRPARGGYEAVAHWRASSTGRAMAERKRNLSIQSGGVKDFGTNWTGSAIDLVMAARDCGEAEALEFLELQLDLGDDGSVVVDLQPRSVDPEADLPAPLRGLGPSPNTLDMAKCRAARGRTEAVASSPVTPTEMPQHLLHVPGLVGEIIDYVTASARKPQRVLALATALTVVGTCGGRRYAGPTGSGTHLYALACAKSGAGKDHGLDMAARLLTSADMTRHIGKGEWMSFQAVYRSLNQQPLTLNPIDELGGFLRRINKRTSGGNEQAITAVLRTAWGKSFKMLPPPGWAGQDMEPIWSPALSILGASTHDDFFKAIEAGDTDNGFLNRWLLFSTQDRPAVQKPTADLFEVPAPIVDGMLAIYKGGNPLMNATMHHGRCDRPDVVAQWSDGDDGDLNREYLAWAESLDEASDAESFFARAAEQAIRLATIRAIGCDAGHPVIDRECFTWAKEVSLWCANRMLLDAREFMSENQTQSDRAKVVRAIRINSPITHRDLLRKLTTFKTRELEEIIKGLEAAELIRAEPGPPAANNKRSKIYVWLGDQ